MSFEPVIKVNGRELPPASHRGVSVAWASVDGVAAPRREDNGRMVRSSRADILRGMFAVEISGGYMTQPLPCLIGDDITIEGLEKTEVGYVAAADLPRPHDPDSVRYFDERSYPIVDPARFPQAAETRWCPILDLIVMDWRYGGNTMAKATTWSISTEELKPMEYDA